MHETGHALGLSHPHDGLEIANINNDQTKYTIMSYRSYADQPIEGNQSGYRQTFFPTTPMWE
ncbi:MAG: hypothetical protein QNJ72_17540 [Pleurocapsa sp. MO_226.B13]|nr:hypothetical protein [Pleurocapsa sp. MO_226.B13]